MWDFALQHWRCALRSQNGVVATWNSCSRHCCRSCRCHRLPESGLRPNRLPDRDGVGWPPQDREQQRCKVRLYIPPTLARANAVKALCQRQFAHITCVLCVSGLLQCMLSHSVLGEHVCPTQVPVSGLPAGRCKEGAAGLGAARRPGALPRHASRRRPLSGLLCRCSTITF